MAGKRFGEGSEEFLMFRDYWKMCQELWIPEDNDAYWEKVMQDTGSFYEKYKDVDRDFAEGLALALNTSLERKIMNQKKGVKNRAGNIPAAQKIKHLRK